MAELPSEMTQGSVFNMSLESLSRINELLKSCSTYSVNSNWLGLRNNLLEVYKELVRCSKLKDEEKMELKTRWETLQLLKCGIDKRGLLIYDERLPALLTEFDFFIGSMLFKQGLSMAKSEDAGRSLK